MRVLGIDTSLRSTGVGVVEARQSRLKAIAYGRIRTPASKPLSACLTRLHDGLNEMLDAHQPETVAIEGAFYQRNVKTTMVLGHARGVAIQVCAARGLPIYEYAPRRVKQAVVGVGSASKDQVRQMIMRMLSLKDEPDEDASDALAIAVCHLHNRTAIEALGSKSL